MTGSAGRLSLPARCGGKPSRNEPLLPYGRRSVERFADDRHGEVVGNELTGCDVRSCPLTELRFRSYRSSEGIPGLDMHHTKTLRELRTLGSLTSAPAYQA